MSTSNVRSSAVAGQPEGDNSSTAEQASEPTVPPQDLKSPALSHFTLLAQRMPVAARWRNPPRTFPTRASSHDQEMWTQQPESPQPKRHSCIPRRDHPRLPPFTNDGHNCPIHIERLENPVGLVCRHVFCRCCIEEWQDIRPICPLCRYEFERGMWWDVRLD